MRHACLWGCPLIGERLWGLSLHIRSQEGQQNHDPNRPWSPLSSTKAVAGSPFHSSRAAGITSKYPWILTGSLTLPTHSRWILFHKKPHLTHLPDFWSLRFITAEGLGEVIWSIFWLQAGLVKPPWMLEDHWLPLSEKFPNRRRLCLWSHSKKGLLHGFSLMPTY